MIRNYLKDWSTIWNRFWFTPRTAETLGVMRILVGSMLVYTHLVWAVGGHCFFGDAGVIPETYRQGLMASSEWAWSHFDWLPNDSWLLPMHVLAIAIFVSFTVGYATRVTGILSWLLVVSYANRTIGAQFGLDQTNAFLTFYLAIGNSGDAFSVDSWLRRRAGQGFRIGLPSVSTNIATRLIQIHLCVVYLFAGIGKAQGAAWINGDAIMMALSSYEYQSLNLVWLVDHLWLVNLATLIALVWELSYAALVWHRLTRPLMIGLAVMVHLGIGLAMGMMTFGLAMIYANLAFVEPQTISKLTRSWSSQATEA